MSLLHVPRQREPEVCEEARKALEDAASDWPEVRKVAEHNRRLYSTNGFIEALSRAQEGPR